MVWTRAAREGAGRERPGRRLGRGARPGGRGRAPSARSARCRARGRLTARARFEWGAALRAGAATLRARGGPGDAARAGGPATLRAMLGGTPATVPERYAQASPIRLLPLGIPQVLVIGEHGEFVPRPLVEGYVEAAAKVGDAVRLIVIPGAGHFELASPRTSAWPRERVAIRSLLEGRLPE